MIDAQAMVFLPGARLIIPECVLPGGVGDGTQRVREPKAEQRLKAFTGGGAKQGVIDPGGRIMDVLRCRNDVEISGQHQWLLGFQPLLRIFKKS